MALDATRVSSWDDYIGQEALKKRLRIQINAAVEQCRELEHVLLAAPPGYGKTSLAQIIASEMSARFESRRPPFQEAAIARVIHDYESRGEYLVLFLDDIHNASHKEIEFLNPLLEFGFINDHRGLRYESWNLTVIGAATAVGDVPKPLYDHFLIVPSWDTYTDGDMARIILGMARRFDLSVSEEVASELAKETGRNPRHARKFVLACRDLANNLGRLPTSDEVLDFCRVESPVAISAARDADAPEAFQPRFCGTPADFEIAAADWLRAWGYQHVSRTPTGPDGGADVIADGAVAQVKAWMIPIGRPDIQQLRGVAHDGRTAFFFSLTGYTPGAIAFANQSGVALFRFAAYDGSIEPSNEAGRNVIEVRGRP